MELMFEQLSNLFPKSSSQILQEICDALSPHDSESTDTQTENQNQTAFEAQTETLLNTCDNLSNLPELENAPQEKTPLILPQSKKIKKEPVQIKKSKADDTQISAKQSSNRKKEIWKPEEDSQLVQLYNEYGPKWSKIAACIENRTGKQVRDRYLNTLKPDINYTDWTPEEEKKLESLFEQFGKKWCEIARHLPGRTENQVKNKFYWQAKKKTSRRIKRAPRVSPEISGINLQKQTSTESQITKIDSSVEQDVLLKDGDESDHGENLSEFLSIDQIVDDNFRELTWDHNMI